MTWPTFTIACSCATLTCVPTKRNLPLITSRVLARSSMPRPCLNDSRGETIESPLILLEEWVSMGSSASSSVALKPKSPKSVVSPALSVSSPAVRFERAVQGLQEQQSYPYYSKNRGGLHRLPTRNTGVVSISELVAPERWYGVDPTLYVCRLTLERT